ncbi:MAG: DNA repair protein [Pseudomonadota bacterium]
MTIVDFSGRVQALMHAITLSAIVALALAAGTLTALSAAGLLGWLELSITFGGVVYSGAGPIVQIALTFFCVGLCVFLPGQRRILALERSHRTFDLTMEDVARAYHAAHAADRGRAFRLGSEFDAVKERLMHLRDHPDLGHLEPEVLELAAQMSYQARDLAEIYSDDKVARARTFLQERQSEVETTRARIEEARRVSRDFRRWVEEVELDESVLASQLAMLRDEFADLFPRGLPGPEDDAPEPYLRAAE